MRKNIMHAKDVKGVPINTTALENPEGAHAPLLSNSQMQ